MMNFPSRQRSPSTFPSLWKIYYRPQVLKNIYDQTVINSEQRFTSVAAFISPLSAALALNSSLASLNLDNNGLGATGGQILFEVLASNSTLKRLTWSGMIFPTTCSLLTAH